MTADISARQEALVSSLLADEVIDNDDEINLLTMRHDLVETTSVNVSAAVVKSVIQDLSDHVTDIDDAVSQPDMMMADVSVVLQDAPAATAQTPMEVDANEGQTVHTQFIEQFADMFPTAVALPEESGPLAVSTISVEGEASISFVETTTEINASGSNLLNKNMLPKQELESTLMSVRNTSDSQPEEAVSIQPQMVAPISAAHDRMQSAEHPLHLSHAAVEKTVEHDLEVRGNSANFLAEEGVSISFTITALDTARNDTETPPVQGQSTCDEAQKSLAEGDKAFLSSYDQNLRELLSMVVSSSEYVPSSQLLTDDCTSEHRDSDSTVTELLQQTTVEGERSYAVEISTSDRGSFVHARSVS